MHWGFNELVWVNPKGLPSQAESDQRRLGGGSEQFLPVRLAVCRQSEPQPLRGLWPVAAGELTENVGFLVV